MTHQYNLMTRFSVKLVLIKPTTVAKGYYIPFIPSHFLG